MTPELTDTASEVIRIPPERTFLVLLARTNDKEFVSAHGWSTVLYGDHCGALFTRYAETHGQIYQQNIRFFADVIEVTEVPNATGPVH